VGPHGTSRGRGGAKWRPLGQPGRAGGEGVVPGVGAVPRLRALRHGVGRLRPSGGPQVRLNLVMVCKHQSDCSCVCPSDDTASL
jgi:hypothetical protein